MYGSISEDFLDTLQNCFLTQKVNKPTYKDNLLDLVMTSDPFMVENLKVENNKALVIII